MRSKLETSKIKYYNGSQEKI